MAVNRKVAAGLILLVVGMFLLMEGSKLDPVRGEIVDMGMMGVGAALVVGYIYLMRNLLSEESSYKVLMPILFVLGLTLIYQTFTRSLEAASQALFGSLGVVLTVASAYMLWRRSKR